MIGISHNRLGVCEWHLYDDPDYPVWHTECGHEHQFMDGGPKDNLHIYCPYRGRMLSEKGPTIPDEEADDE
jgi:hypothetical protein